MQIALRNAHTLLQNCSVELTLSDAAPLPPRLPAGRPAPDVTKRQRDTRERVLTYAQALMAACGTLTLKFPTLAAAVHVAPNTLRHHFADLDDLLTALVVRHLDTLFAALTETPNDIEALLGNLRAAPRPPAKGDFIPNVAYVPPPGFFEDLARERAEPPGPATFPREPPNPT
jgi:AcrR family transcriptional regulator